MCVCVCVYVGGGGGLNEINDVITIEMVEEVKNTFKNLGHRYMH